MSRSFPTIEGYVIRNKIGDGGFSKVYRAVHYTKNLVAACKVVPITQQTWTSAAQKDLYKEIKVHSQLKHEHILAFLTSETYEDDEKTSAAKFVPAVYMLLEFAAGGDLFDKIVPDVGVSENVAHLYFTQLLSGIEFMHGKGVCHRDLKPENAMLSLNGLLKICDFGLCAVYKHKGMERMLTERCGSLPYVAPELSQSVPYHAEPIDIWGCGVILYTMLVGNTPWDEPTQASPEYVAFVSGDIREISPWDTIPGPTLDLLVRLLNPNPQSRATIPEIHSHPWFAQDNPLLLADEGALADAIAASLKETGYMEVVHPPEAPAPGATDKWEADTDGDSAMLTAGHAASQFTQSLMLYSQTQGGTRHTPEMTRFYTGHGCLPEQFISLAVPVLKGMSFRCRQPEIVPKTSGSGTASGDGFRLIRMKIMGMDTRNMVLKGDIEVEVFDKGCFVLMRRETGDPLSWKRLWRSLVNSPSISPYVLRRQPG
ncbi:Chk1 protein kinase [Tulasnella sp. JGI-2019a]|nr:Chk1 protein kinase [Tulasnella sp. JGI-2019a]